MKLYWILLQEEKHRVSSVRVSSIEASSLFLAGIVCIYFVDLIEFRWVPMAVYAMIPVLGKLNGQKRGELKIVSTIGGFWSRNWKSKNIYRYKKIWTEHFLNVLVFQITKNLKKCWKTCWLVTHCMISSQDTSKGWTWLLGCYCTT